MGSNQKGTTMSGGRRLSFHDLQVRLGHLDDDIQHLLEVIRPDWKGRQLTKGRFPQGQVNTVLCCHPADDSKKRDAVVVRVFKMDATCTSISRDKEVMFMQLAHAAGVFPEILGLFRNGIVYRYAHGRTLDAPDLENERIMTAIARAHARLNHVNPANVPLVDAQGNSAILPVEDLETIFHTYWNNRPEHLQISDRDIRYQSLLTDVAETASLLRDTCAIMRDLNLETGVIHRDLHAQNIVYDDETGDIIFVDYELCLYGGWAYYDLATKLQTFRFSMLIGTMSPTEGPSPQMRDIMLRAYIKSKYETLGKNPNDITDHVIEVASTQLAATEIAYFLSMWMTAFTFVDSQDIGLLALAFLEMGKKQFLARKDKLPGLRDRYVQLTQKS